MSEAKHTPGPWRCCTGSHKDKGTCICGVVWGPSGNIAVAAVQMRRCEIQDHADCAPPDEVGVANSRLIAAAPELLAAVRDALAAGDRDMQHILDNGQLRDRLRAAIAMATGQYTDNWYAVAEA